MKQALVVLAVVLGVAVSAAGQEYVGGDKGITLPRVIKEVKPHYPKAALAAKKSAIVTVNGVVRPDGRPTRVRVEKPGDPAFDDEAVKALRQWRFKTGLKDGTPVPVRIVDELTFTAK